MPFRIPTLRSIPVYLLATLAGVALACSSGDDTPVTPETPAQWRWMAPVSEGATLTDVWGPSADNLFATGLDGMVLRYDGSDWRKTRTISNENLNGVWGTSASHVIAVGDNGVILRFDGSSWTSQASGTDKRILDVWGASATDVFAVGEERMVLHYDGAAWTPMTVPPGFEALASVWGSGPSDVYATGLGKKLLHYDGTWSEVSTPASFALTAVWGTAFNDVFAVGVFGAAIHFDGVAWTPIDVPSAPYLATVCGTSTSDVYAMGLAGAAVRWDGFTWSPVETEATKKINRMFAVDGRIFAVGEYGTLIENAGGGFVHARGGLTVDLDDVWVSSRGDVFAVGKRGTIVRLRQRTWERMESGTTRNLHGVHGVSGDDVIAVGDEGTIARYDGVSWAASSEGPGFGLNEVFMLATDDAFAVGGRGVILRLQGGVWSDVSLPAVTDSLLAAWGPSSDNVYVVGAQSRAFNWNGLQWKLVTIDPLSIHTFQDVHGTSASDVYVATEYFSPAAAAAATAGALHAGGYIFHWNGSSWQPVYQDPGHDILGLWSGSTERAFACGDAAALLTRSGGAWARVFALDHLPFKVTSVWGTSTSNVFVVGDNGTLASYSQ